MTGYPDFWVALGLAIVSTGDDEAVVEMRAPDWSISPFGVTTTVSAERLAMTGALAVLEIGTV